MRVSQVKGNRRLYQAECIHVLVTPESERLKITALSLLHPTASPPFPRGWFLHIATQPHGEDGRGIRISSEGSIFSITAWAALFPLSIAVGTPPTKRAEKA
jgi:hypothetical protein